MALSQPIRGLLLVVALTALQGLAQPAAAQLPSVDAECDTAAGQDNCKHWYRTDEVFLHWDVTGVPISPPPNCANETFKVEARSERSCVVQKDGKTAGQTVWLGIDRTPPQVLAPQLSRAADDAGWFNHPVSMTFRGSDKTSGVAWCSSATYGGPDGSGMSIGGSCSDVAGNVGSGSFGLNYDATPPSLPKLTVKPGNKLLWLGWSSSEPVEAEVVRLQRGRAPVMAYRGGGGAFTDRSLRNERRYRYVVVVEDRAGNRSQSEVSAVPTASKLLSPARNAHVGSPPKLLWKRAKHASYYNVQLYRGRKKVLSRWPRKTALQLRGKWSYGGHRRRLAPGRYTWYVWPGRGRRSAHRYGRLLGKSTFNVVR